MTQRDNKKRANEITEGAEVSFECESVLLDMDGVLVDSSESVAKVWREWAESHGLDPDTVLQTAHGHRAVETVQIVAPHLDAETEAGKVEIGEIEDAPHVRPIDQSAEFVSTLPSGRWAVVTSATRDLAKARLRQAGIPIPQAFVTAGDVERGKPDPQGYLRAAEMLGSSPGRCLVLEDAPTGVAAAQAAGMITVAVATTHTAADLTDAHVVTSSIGHILIEAHSPTSEGSLHVTVTSVPRDNGE